MRIVIAAATALIAGATAGIAAPAPARLAPADIQKSFFNGEPFTAATPGGIAFKMVFMPNGKVSREPVGKSGVKGDGSWKLDKDGFCTTWKGSAANCYTLVNVEKNKWSVVKGATTVAVWSK